MTDDHWWRGAGERIQQLLDAVSSPAVDASVRRRRAEQLAAEVAGLYGAALARMTTLSDAATVQRFADDDLVASLLVVHGLHPHDLQRRVIDALERVRPYLGSHGGDVELLEITHGDVVRLRFTGSCRSCPSSSATLELAVEDSVRAAAPEITDIVVVTDNADPQTIAPQALFASIRSRATTSWHPVAGLSDLGPGEVGGFEVDGVDLLACRVGGRVLVYRDRCPECLDSLAGAALRHRPDLSEPVLCCPRCGTEFDVVHAGISCAGSDAHLEPMPLLSKDGMLCVATARPTDVSA